MTNFIPVITSPHDSSPAVALRLGRNLPGLLPVAVEFTVPVAPDWIRRAIVGGE